MLGKCFKYDMKAYARTFVPLLIIFSVSEICMSLFADSTIKADTVLGILVTIFIVPLQVISMILTVFSILIVAAMRYNEVFFSDKAYLMRTLPVSGRIQFLSILLNTLFWLIITIVTVIGFSIIDKSTLFSSLVKSFIADFNIKEFWSVLFYTGSSFLLTQMLLMLAVFMASRMKMNRTAAIIVCYFALNMAVSFFISVFLVVARRTGSEGYYNIYYAVKLIIAIVIIAFLAVMSEKKVDLE
ncbi:MAG: hypothetical protein IJ555_05165 [Ruminococcus sp.]|nr:hypothetical protein [Ruminococcus sp.]